jgi:hypothetical protein
MRFRIGDIITHSDKYVREQYGERFEITDKNVRFGINLVVQPLDKPTARPLTFAYLDKCKIIPRAVEDTFDKDGIE